MIPRIYLITASTGIGAETARQLATLGHRLFIVSRNPVNVNNLVDELRGLGAEVESAYGDLTDPNVGPLAVSKCVDCFGRIDGLYNVAGISARKFGDGPLHECTEKGWQKVLDTNLTTQYRMCREVLRQMLSQEPHSENAQRGVILNMASILGIHPEPKNFSAIGYAAAKGAILSMTRASAAFYAEQRIRINAIAPALVQTPMSARASESPEVLSFISKKQPLVGGVIPVTDAASVSVFLLSDASRAMTGEVLEVDAGWNLC
ncbi:Glucose 1-dehydrogenase [Planctomycetes bacterium CA13]|uniref:Glucose 1-dehydrogenase n=1 Tax=Novipirellula herctigrandis TaxID=2527986 RepID=A0A5C5ZA91_9BACT|nr:Glucose 1-dehydrogenase [Planctomycetes bacterium CA13]